MVAGEIPGTRLLMTATGETPSTWFSIFFWETAYFFLNESAFHPHYNQWNPSPKAYHFETALQKWFLDLTDCKPVYETIETGYFLMQYICGLRLPRFMWIRSKKAVDIYIVILLEYFNVWLPLHFLWYTCNLTLSWTGFSVWMYKWLPMNYYW